ncbi:sigma-70 family RNA polymerase sigma factor [Streptomyces sp. BV286]|uniref:RNA polymerase sigma factor n=1 Tax=Streptomyces sp. BV286 TaxID=2849672 RepID=UPI001C2E078F|nr:sigma-70 family RNA polymerase sigma factor [Streptomyces sp. BV286]MBV1940858.1 sigma-70 family RNA polymerase sigma factor [Streptomyces sp. BV286]
MSENPCTPEDFNAFFRRMCNPTVKRLMRYGRLTQHDAEDIAQQAFAETSKNWVRIRKPEGFLWDRVTKRLLDHIREQKRIPIPYDLSEDFTLITAPVDGEPERHVDAERLKELIRELPIDDQAVLLLQRMGASCKEMADFTGATEGAVRVRLCRARKQLKTMIKREAEVR